MPKHFSSDYTKPWNWMVRRLLNICYSKKMCGLHYNHVFLSCLLYFGLKIFIFLNKRLTLCIGKITYALELRGVCSRQHLPRFLWAAFCWPINRGIQGLPRQGLPCSENVVAETKAWLWVGRIPQGPAPAKNKGRARRESRISAQNTDVWKHCYSVTLRINHAFLT